MAVDESFSDNPSAFHHVQSPRVQGCVSSFFHLFDWYPGKRISTSKSLVVPPDVRQLQRRKSLSGAQSFKECTDSQLGAKLLSNEEENHSSYGAMQTKESVWSEKHISSSCTSVSSNDSNNTRIPGVVARLMGLESLPERTPILQCHLEDPHMDLLHEHVSTMKSVAEKKHHVTMTQGKLNLELEKEREAFGNSSIRTHRGSSAPWQMVAGDKQSSRFQLHSGMMLRNRKGLCFTPESCFNETDLDAKLLKPDPEPLLGSVWGPLSLESKCFKESVRGLHSEKVNDLPSNAQTSLRSCERLVSETRAMFSRAQEKVRSCGHVAGSTANMSVSEVPTWEGGSTVTTQYTKEVQGSNWQRRGRLSECQVVSETQLGLSPDLSHPTQLLKFPRGLSSPEAPTLEFKTDMQRNQINDNLFFTNSERSHDGDPYQTERTLQRNHRCRVDEEQKQVSEQQQINDIFLQVSNLQNEKCSHIINEASWETEEQESRVKVDFKWEASEGKFEADFDGWGLSFVKESPVTMSPVMVNGRTSFQQPPSSTRFGTTATTTQQFKYKGNKGGNKDTEDQEKCILLSKSPFHLDGSKNRHCPPGDVMQVLQSRVNHRRLLNTKKLSSSRKHRVRREWSKGGDSNLASQLPVSRTTQQHSCVLMEAAAAAASESSLKPGFVSLGRQNQSKICRADGSQNMIKGPYSNLELLIPGDNIAGTMIDAVGNNESEASGPASVPRELLSNRSKSHFSAKKCLFHPRSRSVDEVFPELPWDETHLKPRSKEEEDDISTVGFANLPSKPPQICNDWVPDKFFTNFTAAGCFSNSPMLQVHHDNNKDSSPPVQQDHSSLGQLFVSNSDLASCNPIERQWVPMKHSPENNNADVLLCDLDTDSSSTVTESCSSPDSEENLRFKPLNAGWNEDPVTPIFAKTFLDKSSKVTSLMHLGEADKVKLQDASTEECGQPSPVSILESPFLDEIQTTSEESVSESELSLDGILEHGYIGVTEQSCLLLDNQAPGIEKNSNPGGAELTAIVESNKLRQALLDISSFRKSNKIATMLNLPGDSQQEEMNYIREVLNASDFLSETPADGTSAQQSYASKVVAAVNPSLFEQLELRSSSLEEISTTTTTTGGGQLKKNSSWDFLNNNPWRGSLWRGDRKLLFDSLSEIIGTIFCDLQFSCRSFVTASKPPQQLKAGEKLVTEVYGKICEWRKFATNTLQSLLDRDMRVHGWKWLEPSQEITELGFDIEQMLFKGMIDELIDDLYPVSKSWNSAH